MSGGRKVSCERFLHGSSDRELLRQAYNDSAQHVPGQWCNGESCGICPPITGGAS